MFMNNCHENLSKRIESENEGVILTVKSTATNRQIEILKKMYPNSEIIIQSKCPLCDSR